MILTAPSIALAFGVLAPAAIALDRLARGQTSRLANALLDIKLSVPALVGFSMGVALTRAAYAPVSFVVSRPVVPKRLQIVRMGQSRFYAYLNVDYVKSYQDFGTPVYLEPNQNGSVSLRLIQFDR